jgi:hypothetical protein
MGFETGTWLFTPLGSLDSRRLCWCLVLYGEPGILLEQSVQSQSPTGSVEGHLSYDFKPRLWISHHGNYWFGGKTSVDGLENSTTLQRNSRVGVTASFPLTRHQSLKLSYNNGAYIKYGGNYQNISFGWQYSWLGWPN